MAEHGDTTKTKFQVNWILPNYNQRTSLTNAFVLFSLFLEEKVHLQKKNCNPNSVRNMQVFYPFVKTKVCFKNCEKTNKLSTNRYLRKWGKTQILCFLKMQQLFLITKLRFGNNVNHVEIGAKLDLRGMVIPSLVSEAVRHSVGDISHHPAIFWQIFVLCERQIFKNFTLEYIRVFTV